MTVTTVETLALEHVQGRLAQLPQTRTTDEVMIDKDVAEELLKHNTHNRHLQQAKIAKYVGEMARGRWMDCADPIRISRTGKILDGQHKLHAIVEADVEHIYTITWGLEDKTQKYMDTGSKRALAQALGLEGEKNPTMLGGAVRMVWQIENGGTPSKWEIEPTYEEYCEFVVDNPQIRDSVEVTTRITRNLKVPGSPIAAAHYVCVAVDQTAADEFFTDLGDLSAVIEDDSAVAALRRTTQLWIRRGSVSRMEQASLYDVVIRAFDAHREGREMVGSFRLTRRPRTFRRPAVEEA